MSRTPGDPVNRSPWTPRLAALAQLVLLAALALGGCGSDSESSSGGETKSKSATPTSTTRGATETSPAASADTGPARPSKRSKPKSSKQSESKPSEQSKRTRKPQAGAGGAGDDGSVKPAPVPRRAPPAGADAARQKAAFIKRFDAACTRLRGVARRLGRNPGTRASYLRRLGMAQADAVATLRAIRPPARDRAAIRRNLAIRAETATLLQKLGDAIERDDQQAVQTLGARIARNIQRTNQFARRYGFKVCGSGGVR